MTSCNSGYYIDLQLKSILPQLDEDDEIVIVDDNSTDGTPDRICSLADPRIRLIKHKENVGVVRSFEHALRTATGDILFLSDHDDLWAPDKVRQFREVFALKPDVQLVISAVSLIDAQGKPFHDPRLDRNGRFERGFLRNVLKNGYQGSAMAIRSSLLEKVLPFPLLRGYLHDAWIGTVNDRLGGGVVFLPEPLLLYRRHLTNVSQRHSRGKQLLIRGQLLWDHLWHALRAKGSSGSA